MRLIVTVTVTALAIGAFCALGRLAGWTGKTLRGMAERRHDRELDRRIAAVTRDLDGEIADMLARDGRQP